MIANYHTHTTRCHHAEGADEEYVRCAIQSGLQVLGFSDHTPYLFPGSYYSTFRMRPEELAGYVQSVRALQARYADRIDIRLGVEIEYYPALFSRTLQLLQAEGIEYMILGQHCLCNEEGAPYCGTDTDSEMYLAQYCDQCIEAMHTGLFTYLAHPDLFAFRGPEELYGKHMYRLCLAAKECAVPLEINLLGLRTGRAYPREQFWQIAGQVGNTVILGCDAHNPKDLLDTIAVEKALQIVATNRLNLVDALPLKPICK